MKKRIICIALLAASLLLAACGEKQGNGAAKLSAAGVYTSETIPLDLPLNELTAAASGSGSLYLAGLEEEPSEDGAAEEDAVDSGFSFSTSSTGDGGFTIYSGGGGRAALYQLDGTSGALVKLEGYVPESGGSVTKLVPCADGSLWVLEQISGSAEGINLDSLEEGGRTAVNLTEPAAVSQVWRHLDAAGAQELERVDITDLVDKLHTDAVTDTLMDGVGLLYAASGSTVTVLDVSLTVRFACKTPEAIDRLVPLADAGAGAVTGGESSPAVYPVNAGAQALDAACPLSGNGGTVYAGDGKYNFLYQSGDGLYGWPRNGSAPEKVLSWSGAAVDSAQVAALTFLADGQGAALLRDGSGWPAAYSLARLTPAGEDALAGRTVLTLATMGMDSETRTRVLEFNRTNGKYRIEVLDYSEFNTAGDNSAGLNKLNTEILAGNMPDLLDVSGGVPLRQYAARGMLEDLWPFVSSDPALGREGVMSRVLEADSIQGKLCRVFPRFTIRTAAGAPSVVGNRMGWTLEDLKAALAKQPAGCTVSGAAETSNTVLESLFSDSLDQFIDWEAGTSSFDSPAFRAILAFCGTFPAQARENGENTDAYTRVARGEQLLLPVYLNDLSSLQIYRKLFGGEAAFVGYPNEAGRGVSFHVEGGIAMSAACKDKDAAWSFLRQALLTQNEKFIWDFPVNRAEFQRKAQESMAVTYVTDENGNQITGPDGKPIKEGTSFIVIDGQAIMLEPATQADYDQVMALYEAADSVSGRDENIWAIVRECAGAYFAGDQTAEEAARAIQSRVGLYINEQK